MGTVRLVAGYWLLRTLPTVGITHGLARPSRHIFVSFEGRIGRQRTLACIAAAGAYLTVWWMLGLPMSLINARRALAALPMTTGNLILLGVWLPFGLWISLAPQVKRWHDRGKSGWWWSIGLIPVVGQIWTLVETGFLRGTSGPNRFGNEPPSGR